MRYCAMDDFTPQIVADGGKWAESEVLGGYAVVKVSAASTTLTTIGGTTNFYRITNHIVLSDTLSDLTTTQRNAITTRVLAMGYTQAELDAVMGNTLALWRLKNFLTLLNFIAQRKLTPRWNATNQMIVLDGILQSCEPITGVDAKVI
jgi:hypothetical protein